MIMRYVVLETGTECVICEIQLLKLSLNTTIEDQVDCHYIFLNAEVFLLD